MYLQSYRFNAFVNCKMIATLPKATLYILLPQGTKRFAEIEHVVGRFSIKYLIPMCIYNKFERMFALISSCKYKINVFVLIFIGVHLKKKCQKIFALITPKPKLIILCAADHYHIFLVR